MARGPLPAAHLSRRRGGARRLLAAVSLALAGLVPATAAADLAACKRAYEDQRFEEAVSLCGAVAREPLAPRAAVLSALEVTGMAHLVLGQERPARSAFCLALAVDPRYRPTDPIYPQRFVAVFEAARGACPPGPRLELESLATRDGAAVRVRLAGPVPAGARLGVYYRAAGEEPWRRELVSHQSRRVDLPGLDLAAAAGEVFAVLLGAGSDVVARAGSVDRPLRLARLALPPPVAPPSPARLPLWKRSWFWWAVAGVAATTLVVSISVGVSSRGGVHGSLDTVRLPLRLSWR